MSALLREMLGSLSSAAAGRAGELRGAGEALRAAAQRAAAPGASRQLLLLDVKAPIGTLHTVNGVIILYFTLNFIVRGSSELTPDQTSRV